MARLTTFIAIPIPEETKPKLAQIQENLKKQNLPIAWEDPNKAHITLVYLGKISQERMEVACKTAEQAAKNHQPFELHLGPIGYFAKEKGTRHTVTYLNIIDPQKNLRNLYKDISKNLSHENFYPPERLQPHLTLGRIKKMRSKQEMQKVLTQIDRLDLDPNQTLPVNQINIYKSDYPQRSKIHAGQPTTKHHLLKSYPLGI